MIRLARETDIPQILEIYGPYVLETTASFEYEAPAVDAFTQRFRRITERFPWLVWEAEGQILGYAYGSAPFDRAAYQWCAEVSIYLRKTARGQGIGKRLYGALETLLKQQGFAVIYAIITSENQASLEFHRRVGYRKTAEMPGCGYKFGRELGIVWMEKRLISGDIPMAPPVRWETLVKNDRNCEYILANLTLS